MDRTAAVAGLAVALLVGAGAIGVYVLTDTPDQDPSESGAAAFPDGLSADGNTNASELVASHEVALNGTSYALTRSVQASYANGTYVTNWAQNLDIGPRAQSYLYVQTANATVGEVMRNPERLATWSNGSVTITRSHAGNRTVLYRGRGFQEPGVVVRSPLQWILTSVNTSFEGQTFGPPFTVHATTVVDTLRHDEAFENPRNVTFTATITENGVVESFRLEYTATFRGDRIRVVERYQLTARGVDVPEPDWVDEAIRRTAN